MNQQTVQNNWSEKNMIFFQRKQLLGSELLSKIIAWTLLAVSILMIAGGVVKDDCFWPLGALIPLGLATVIRTWQVVILMFLITVFVLMVVAALRDNAVFAIIALIPLAFVVWHCVKLRMVSHQRVRVM